MARKCENLRLNSFSDLLSIQRRKQCFNISNAVLYTIRYVWPYMLSTLEESFVSNLSLRDFFFSGIETIK